MDKENPIEAAADRMAENLADQVPDAGRVPDAGKSSGLDTAENGGNPRRGPGPSIGEETKFRNDGDVDAEDDGIPDRE